MLSKERISSLERELTLSSSTLQNVNDELSVKCEDYDVSLFDWLLYTWCVLDFKCNLSHLTAMLTPCSYSTNQVMKRKLFETEQEMEKTKQSLIQTTTENSRSVGVALLCVV